MIDWFLIWQNTWSEFLLLLKAPLFVPEMWWIITPLIVTTLLMTFYFGAYFREKLGWNTALGNSIVLLFVGIDLLRTIYNYTLPASIWNLSDHPIKLAAILFVMLEGALLSYTAFRHGLPKSLVFFIASPAPVNLQAYVLTAIVYLKYRPTVYTLLAAVLFFLMLLAILKLLQEIEHIKLGYHFKKKPEKH